MDKYKPQLDEQVYFYRALLASNYDGDTVRVRFDLGFGIGLGAYGKGENLRLYGMNAPELYRPNREIGHASRDRLTSLLTDQPLVIQTIKAPRGEDRKGKYGRYLAIVYVETDQGWLNCNQTMIDEGHAEVKVY